MREITVKTYPVGPSFSTPEEAIAHSFAYPPLLQARADWELVRGSQFVDAWWTDEDFVIRFSNEKFLHVFVDAEAGRNIRWRVLATEPVIGGAGIERVGSPAVLLNFSRAGPYVMDRSALVTARRGRDVTQFFVNEVSFYVYTPRQLILTFGVAYRADNGRNLLYVCEDR